MEYNLTNAPVQSHEKSIEIYQAQGAVTAAPGYVKQKSTRKNAL